MLSVLTPPASTALTTVAAVRAELKLATEEFDDDLVRLIGDATDAIGSHLDRTCGRRLVRETLAGTDDAILQLGAPPVVAVSKVTRRGEVVLDYEVDDPNAGHLYREAGWGGQSVGAGLFGGVRPATTGPRDWAVEYLAGWLLPGDDYQTVTVTAESSDKSFTDAAAGFPLLGPGEVIEVDGGANAGRRTIVTATATKLTFVEAVTTEASSAYITLRVRTLPRDIERACLTTAAAWRLAQARDPEIASKRVADMTITYRDGSAADHAVRALPPRALGLLMPWVRT